MSSGSRLPLSKPPERLLSARYFLIALVLHGLVLGYPLTLSVDHLEATSPATVQVKLKENVSAVQPSSQKTEKPAAHKAPLKDPRAHTARPMLALTQEQDRAPATYTVAAPTVAPPVSQPAAAPANSSAQPAITAARFDAAHLHNPHPEYPTMSRRLGEEGKVLLKVRVTSDGRTAAVDVEKSSNFDRLDEAALRSVARWRFVPAKRGDEAIEATVMVPIVFRLDN